MSLKEEIKAAALNMGADLVGVAPVERFAGARSQNASGLYSLLILTCLKLFNRLA